MPYPAPPAFIAEPGNDSRRICSKAGNTHDGKRIMGARISCLGNAARQRRAPIPAIGERCHAKYSTIKLPHAIALGAVF
jgi:hypothetical protein